ncbi:hypothetical protein OAB00_02730 [Akkermansiaceae bacterium]|nr:hypothetical protein [Akkermansiaceae bacterium]
MNPTIQALEGVFEHKMDTKCRVSIPVDWRDAAGDGYLRLLQSSSYGLKVLRVVTETEYRNMLQQVESSNMNDKQKKQMLGRLHANCLKTTMNDQGKLAIPKAWCELPELNSSETLLLVGRGTYFELFNQERYNQMLVLEEEETSKLDEEFGFF